MGLIIVLALSGIAVIAMLVGISASHGSGNSSEATPSSADDASERASGGGDSGVGGGGEWFDVRKRNFDLTVVAMGELDAKNRVELKCLVEGRTTIVWVIDEGVRVEEGQELVRLASDELRNKVDQQSLDTERARADQIAATQDMEIRLNETQSDLKAAQVKFELAALDLSKWEKGDLPQKKSELTQLFEKAQRDVVRAKRDLELSDQLYKEKFISLGELEDDQVEVIDCENRLITAKLNVEVYAQFTEPMERARYTSALDQAKAELERTQSKNTSKLAQARADLDSKTRALKIHEEKLSALRLQVEATVIKAPRPGLVVYASSMGNRRWRGEPIAQGRQVQLNEVLLLLPDTRQLVAKLRVHEALMRQVQVGQKAAITIDARPGSALEGTVSSIGVMAEDGGWMNPQLREYEVVVELPPQDGEALKPAMRCGGQIYAGAVQEALAVPVQAVFTEGKSRFCYVPDGSYVRRKKVSVGRASEVFVEVLEGLKVGDRVLLREPRPGEARG